MPPLPVSVCRRPLPFPIFLSYLPVLSSRPIFPSYLPASVFQRPCSSVLVLSPRHTFFDRKPCIAKRKALRCRQPVQRHTFSERKTCIATARSQKSAGAEQRHTFSSRKPCIAQLNKRRRVRPMQEDAACAATHHFGKKTVYRLKAKAFGDRRHAATHTFWPRSMCRGQG